MSIVNRIWLIVLLVGMSSCGTLKTSHQVKGGKKTDQRSSKIEIIPNAPRDEEKIASPKAIEVDDAAPAKTEQEPKTFGVFIDSVAFDAFEALGFLQEMEKQKLKPVRVMGVGFGCYVALSWAAENNGNQAEWEAMKFESWSTLSRGNVVGRIVGGASREKFNQEIARNFSKSYLSDFRLQADCPVVARKYPFAMKSAESLGTISEILWTQLNVPSLAREENIRSLSHLSGVVAGALSDKEWGDMSKGLAQDPNFAGWVYLKTRSSFEAVGENDWSYVAFGRLDKEAKERSIRRIGDAKLYYVDLSSSQGRNPDSLMDPSQRRKFLLDGRKKAQSGLGKIKAWLEGP